MIASVSSAGNSKAIWTDSRAQRVAQGDQVAGAFGRHDAGQPGHFQHVAFGHLTIADQPERVGRHADPAAGRARRWVAGLSPTSTMRLAPCSSKCVNGFVMATWSRHAGRSPAAGPQVADNTMLPGSGSSNNKKTPDEVGVFRNTGKRSGAGIPGISRGSNRSTAPCCSIGILSCGSGHDRFGNAAISFPRLLRRSEPAA